MAETNVESELVNNPTHEQIEYLENSRDNSNSSNDMSSGGGSSESVTMEESRPSSSVSSEGLLGNTQPKEDEKTISYTGKDGEEFHYSVREWEDDWNKRNVDNQWQNLGRNPEDMYDVKSGLDRNGKPANEVNSSIGVPKSSYLQGIYERDDKGNYLYQEQLDAVREARANIARNAPMYAEAGTPDYKITTDLNATAAEHQAAKESQAESDIKANEEREAEKEEKEKSADKAELDKMIDDVISYKTGDFAKAGQKVTEVANALTLGIAPKTNDITGLDKDAFRNAVYSYKEESGKSNQEAVTYISELADKSSMGLAKEGIEYYIRTGDTLGNKHAVDYENRVTEVTDAFINGKISEEEYNKQMDQLSNVSNIQQILSLLSSPAVIGVEAMIAGGAIGKGVTKIAEKPLAIAADKLAEMAGKVGPKGLEHPFAAKIMDRIFEENKGKIASELFDKYKGTNYDTKIARAITAKPGTVGSLNVGTKAVTENIVEPATVAATAAAEAAKSAKENVGKGVVAGTAVGTATAAPTGIYDESGKMIDSKAIVAERKDKPYEGEDAVTLKSREGEVTVSPREAVIIGESEHLTPERGYTEEVKEKAKGSEVYEKPEVEKIETLPDKQITAFQRGVDIIQALLGGRDINLDRTISAREWYDSTLGKIVDKVSNFFSFTGKDNIDKVGEKGIWDKIKDGISKVGDKVSSIIDSIGSSLKGVVDLRSGNTYVIDDRPSAKASGEKASSEKTEKDGNIFQRGWNSAKEWVNGVIPDKDELVGSVKNAISNVLPNWSDEAKRDLATEAVLHVGDLASYGPIQLAKGVGKYVTDTTDEIYWLTTGNRMSNDDKAALNFIVTNMVGLPLAPASTIARDITEGIGSSNRSAIEAVLSGESNSYIMPYLDEKEASTKTDEDEEIRKRNVDELEEVVAEGNKQEGLGGINLPGLSDEDLAWLVRRPEMKNYNYGNS